MHWRREVTRGHHTHSLILLLRLRADDLLHVVGREPQLLLAPVVPPPPARGERIKASGQILGGAGVLTPHAMPGSSRRRKGGGQKRRLLKPTAGRPAGKPTAPAHRDAAQGTGPPLPAPVLLVDVVDDGLLAERQLILPLRFVVVKSLHRALGHQGEGHTCHHPAWDAQLGDADGQRCLLSPHNDARGLS